MDDSVVLRPDPQPEAIVPSHPEEMKASFAVRVGEKMSFQCSARTTPAGVISAGLALAAVAVALGFLVRAAHGPRNKP